MQWLDGFPIKEPHLSDHRTDHLYHLYHLYDLFPLDDRDLPGRADVDPDLHDLANVSRVAATRSASSGTRFLGSTCTIHRSCTAPQNGRLGYRLSTDRGLSDLCVRRCGKLC